MVNQDFIRFARWFRQKSGFKKLRTADFLMIVGIVEVILLIGGSELPFFGSAWKQYTTALIAYMLISMYYLVVTSQERETKALKKLDFFPQITWVTWGFIAGYAISLVLLLIVPVSTGVVVKSSALMLLIWHGIVAFNEELVFRGVLPGAIGDGPALVLFAFMHFAVYNWNIVAMIWAFFLGIGFLYAYRRTGKLGFSIGLHWAYNGVISGVLVGNFL